MDETAMPDKEKDAAEAAAEPSQKPEAASGSAGAPYAPAMMPEGEVEKLLADVQAGVDEAVGPAPQQALSPFELGEFEAADEAGEPHSMDLLGDVELDMHIELGRTHMRLEDVLQLRGGSVVVLDKLAGDPVDIFVNRRLIARGEVLVLNDNFCVRVTELVGEIL
jgi:flagellar motor switch protein FliN